MNNFCIIVLPNRVYYSTMGESDFVLVADTRLFKPFSPRSVGCSFLKFSASVPPRSRLMLTYLQPYFSLTPIEIGLSNTVLILCIFMRQEFSSTIFLPKNELFFVKRLYVLLLVMNDMRCRLRGSSSICGG